ncbi:MAG: hypothetical protein Q6353_014760 [Candidatus Sigynarchaeum springense]
MNGETFPGYQPKRTPDTIHDYIGTWTCKSGKNPDDVLGKIPEATLDNLAAMVDLLAKYQEAAAKDPGKTVPGNVILGADPEEYVPSEAELVVSELGQAIASIVKKSKPGTIAERLKAAKTKSKAITFVPVLFTHVDVMGSGRFFYARKGTRVTIAIKP